MKAYIYPSGVIISPFQEGAAESFIAGETLREYMDNTLARLGFEVRRVASPAEIPAEKCLILPDHVFASEKALRDFLKQRQRDMVEEPSCLALPKNASSDFTMPLQDNRRQPIESTDAYVYDVFFSTGSVSLAGLDAAAAAAKLREASRPVLTPMKERTIEARLPTLRKETQTMMFPITSSLVCHVCNWTHILWLNQLAWGRCWMELLRRKPAWTLGRIGRGLAAMALRTGWDLAFRFRFQPAASSFLHQLNRTGRGCVIHPTAWLEGCIIGDNVRIGAGAVVRNCIIGDNSIVGDTALMLNSVLGRETYVTDNSVLVWCVIYPGATVGNMKLQVSVVGRNSYLHGFAGFIDARFIGGVQVSHNGGMADTGRSFMGSVVGHDCVMNAKVLIQPGREIPNGVWMVMSPEEAIFDVPRDLPPRTPLVRQGGSLAVFRPEKG
ncbi:MAG: hypothetical protein GMKNLPBB_02443 [Myxococcota bacterium]|nr:hypothetical protein [Myxococcota bacterium]